MNQAYTDILHLMNQYCYRIDAGDLDGFAELFANASFGVKGSQEGMLSGKDEVLTYLDRVILYDGKPLTKHIMTNVQIDVDEQAGEATAQCYITVMQAIPDKFPMQAIFSGHYHDKFEKVDGKWRFKERAISPDLVGDLSVHLHEAL